MLNNKISVKNFSFNFFSERLESTVGTSDLDDFTAASIFFFVN